MSSVARGCRRGRERELRRHESDHGLTITNNIVLRSRWGFFYGNHENGGGLVGSVVANNTFYDATHTVLCIESAAHTGTTNVIGSRTVWCS